MQAPILFVDEKPFDISATEAILRSRQLKEDLIKFGGSEMVEFFDFNAQEFPEFNSPALYNVLADRQFVFIHNSYDAPNDGKGALFPDGMISQLKSASKQVYFVRFSTNIWQRGYSDEEVLGRKDQMIADLPINIENLVFTRDEIYTHFDKFVRYRISENIPQSNLAQYYILRYGGEALRKRAEKLISEIYYDCREQIEIKLEVNTEQRNLANILKKTKSDTFRSDSVGQKKWVIKSNWHNLIGDERAEEICNLTKWDSSKVQRAIERLKSKSYTEPNEYLIDLKKVSGQIALLLI